MSDLNRCEFIGRLGRDPEVRTTADGSKVVNLALAVSEQWKNAAGDRQEKTTWVNITIWNPNLGEIAERYLRKGSKVFIAGAFQTRKFTGADGVEKTATEIVLQKGRGELHMLDGRPPESAPRTATPAAARTAPARDDPFNDEMPY